jgi:hypothetical protein
MDLRPSLQIQTAIKAMLDVVLPAVDANNKLAQEQARLVIGTLSLVLQRLPLTYRYERDELSRFLALADTLQGQTKVLPGAQEALHELATAVEQGEDVLDRARAEPSELEAANFQLRPVRGQPVRHAAARQQHRDRPRQGAAAARALLADRPGLGVQPAGHPRHRKPDRRPPQLTRHAGSQAP